MRHAGGVRIDHAMGLMRLWLVPRGALAGRGRLPRLSDRRSAAAAGAGIASPPRHRDRRGSRHGAARASARAAATPASPAWTCCGSSATGSASRPPANGATMRSAMTTTHDLPTVAGWWSGADLELRRGLGIGERGRRSRERPAERAALWQAFTDAGVADGDAPPADDTDPRRRCRDRLRRAARRGRWRIVPLEDIVGVDRAAQPARHDRPASQLAPPLPAAGGPDAAAARGRAALAPAEQRRQAPVMTPRATLRLQFHKGFTFADAEALVPYFAALGISHLYASPITTARAGSMHGYDVTDPTQVNPELGGEDGAAAAGRCAAARAAGPDRRHRAEPHGGRRWRTRGGSTCCARAAPAATRAASTSTGTARIRSCTARCSCPG